MIDVFEYRKLKAYPHMSVADTEIWNRFIEKYPKEYQYCQYDYHIGDAPAFNTLMDDDEDLNQDKLYRLRIDVIGFKTGYNDLIEIKPMAGVSTIGQIQSYKALFERDGHATDKTQAIIITDRIKPNMDYLCKQANIKLIVV